MRVCTSVTLSRHAKVEQGKTKYQVYCMSIWNLFFVVESLQNLFDDASMHDHTSECVTADCRSALPV